MSCNRYHTLPPRMNLIIRKMLTRLIILPEKGNIFSNIISYTIYLFISQNMSQMLSEMM